MRSGCGHPVRRPARRRARERGRNGIFQRHPLRLPDRHPFMLAGAFCRAPSAAHGRRWDIVARGPELYPHLPCCSRPSSCATTSSQPSSTTTATPSPLPWWPPTGGSFVQCGVRLHFRLPRGGTVACQARRQQRPSLTDAPNIAICNRHFFQNNALTFVQQAPSVTAGTRLPAGRLGLSEILLCRDHNRVQLPAAPAGRRRWCVLRLRRWWQTLRWWQQPSSAAWPRVPSRFVDSGRYGKNGISRGKGFLLLGCGTAGAGGGVVRCRVELPVATDLPYSTGGLYLMCECLP